MRFSRMAPFPARGVLALACLLAALSAAARIPEVGRARELLEARRAPQAFALLDPLEARAAGDPDFDFWLGVSALESGHLDRAAIALERVLVRNPDADAARLELGRTYLRMGSLDLAAQELGRLLPRAPDAAARAVLETHLEEIRRLKARQRYSLSGYVELGAGRDTNLASSTRDFPGAILASFGLPGIEPTGNSIRRQDGFTAANAVVEGAYRLAEDRVAFVAADARLRRYREFGDYDYRMANLVAGYQARRGELVATATAFVQAFRQDGAAVEALDEARIANDRDAAGIGLEVRRPLDGRWNAALGMQLARTRYPSNAGQDTRQVTMSAALEHLPAWWAEATLAARIFYGHDEAVRALNAFTDATASRHTFGLRLSAATAPQARVAWAAVLGWSRRIDDDAFARATLEPTGRDDLLEAYVSAAVRLDARWSLHPYAAYARNRSNIALYAFRKAEGGLALRREFR